MLFILYGLDYLSFSNEHTNLKLVRRDCCLSGYAKHLIADLFQQRVTTKLARRLLGRSVCILSWTWTCSGACAGLSRNWNLAQADWVDLRSRITHWPIAIGGIPSFIPIRFVASRCAGLSLVVLCLSVCSIYSKNAPRRIWWTVFVSFARPTRLIELLGFADLRDCHIILYICT